MVYPLSSRPDASLTDLAKGKAGMDANLSRSDFGREAFASKMHKYQPRIVCFNGKEAAKGFLQKTKVEFGLQDVIGQAGQFSAWWKRYEE